MADNNPVRNAMNGARKLLEANDREFERLASTLNASCRALYDQCVKRWTDDVLANLGGGRVTTTVRVAVTDDKNVDAVLAWARGAQKLLYQRPFQVRLTIQTLGEADRVSQRIDFGYAVELELWVDDEAVIGLML